MSEWGPWGMMPMDGVPSNPKTLKQICTWSLLLAFGFPFFSLLQFQGIPSCRHSLTETHPLVSSCILHLCHPLSVKRLVLPAMSVGREERNKTSFMGFLGRVMTFNREMCEIFADLIAFTCRSTQLVKESRSCSLINQSSECKHDATVKKKATKGSSSAACRYGWWDGSPLLVV